MLFLPNHIFARSIIWYNFRKYPDYLLKSMKNVITMRVLTSASAKEFSWTPLGLSQRVS